MIKMFIPLVFLV